MSALVPSPSTPPKANDWYKTAESRISLKGMAKHFETPPTPKTLAKLAATMSFSDDESDGEENPDNWTLVEPELEVPDLNEAISLLEDETWNVPSLTMREFRQIKH